MMLDHDKNPHLQMARRRVLVLGLGSAAALAVAGCGGSDGEPPVEATWTGAFAAAPQDWIEPIPLPGRVQPIAVTLQDQTVRMPLRLHGGGSAVRIRLSNVTGTVPVTVSASSLSRAAAAAGAAEAGSIQALRFGGAASITIAAGAEVTSDAVEMTVVPGAELWLSLYFQAATPTTTVHRSVFRTGYLVTGNATASTAVDTSAPITRYHLLAGADVRSTGARSVVVAFGDSITDGTNSTIDKLQRYPDHLAARITADTASAGRVSVVNTGIAGNRVLNDKLGPRGVGRFQRDALGQTGVTHVVILLGINDIGFPVFSGPPFNLIPASETVSATQIILGYQQMVDAAKAKNVKVILGTILPFRGAAYFNEANEAKRQDVNAWIRAQTGKVHGIVDFDVAMRSAADPLALNPAFNSGDSLHPNDAGYAALAAAVDLALIRP